MVMIDKIKEKSYKFEGVKKWEEYIDNLIDEESENGLNQVTIRRTPDNVDISSMDRYNIRILKTVISMYKHEGFKCKLRWNKIGRENRVKDLKISW